MGNSRSRAEQKCYSQFLPEEQAEVDALFDTLSLDKDSSEALPRSFSLQALKNRIGEALPPEMVTSLYDGMQRVHPTGRAQGPSKGVSQEQFTVSLSHLLKGSSEERSLMILKMISAKEGPVKARDLQKFTEDLVGSVEHVLAHRQELKGWTRKKAPGTPTRVQALAAHLLSEMKLPDGSRPLGPHWLDHACDRATVEDWVFRVPLVATFLRVVIHQGFPVLCSSLDLATLVPECQLHGQSFSQLCGHITHRGPCLILLEDQDGHVFGGFASCPWEVKPQFQGDERCFLFSVSPSMAVYRHTGYNDHFMYLNCGQQTIPNGLGLGGQHDYFGLWVDADFGKGHSKAKPTCTTYNSPQLSSKENFRFDKMEVWAVGDPPESQLVQGKKSILDVDPEARALLEITGQTRHSEGLREAPEDDA
ncbi:MTOR-associated protein MEAK7 isoform X2 [Marmota flaviventris]|uniref:MTOR-associated protein MEAK7 isoform X2 n=1 Tax=Marmota flaviventris TaxID=93162 RepID=UPI003A83675D